MRLRRVKKFEDYINKIISEKCKVFESTEIWTRLNAVEKRIGKIEKKLFEVESIANSIWASPLFKGHRDGTR